MAFRAAFSRSTATSSSKRGAALSPVASSMERPATPVATQRRTLSATPAASAPNPDSKSAFTGTSAAPAMART